MSIPIYISSNFRFDFNQNFLYFATEIFCLLQNTCHLRDSHLPKLLCILSHIYLHAIQYARKNKKGNHSYNSTQISQGKLLGYLDIAVSSNKQLGSCSCGLSFNLTLLKQTFPITIQSSMPKIQEFN